MRVLALDYGSARCGTALCDRSGTLATPGEVVERPGTKRGMQRIVAIADESGAELVLVGLPLSLSGTDTDQTRESRDFAEQISRRVRVPVELYDERLTTAMAQRTPGSTGEDSRAAAHLLESWLDAQSGGVR